MFDIRLVIYQTRTYSRAGTSERTVLYRVYVLLLFVSTVLYRVYVPLLFVSTKLYRVYVLLLFVTTKLYKVYVLLLFVTTKLYRVYVLVTSLDPLRVYIYDDGLGNGTMLMTSEV